MRRLSRPPGTQTWPGPGDARRQHRIEQVDALVDRVEQVRRRAEAHEVARPRIVGEERHDDVERRAALLRRLVAGQSADVDAVERQAGDEPRRRARAGPARGRPGSPRTAPGPRAGCRARAPPATAPPSGGSAPSRPRRRPAPTTGTRGGRTRPRCLRRAPPGSAIAFSGVSRWLEPSRWLRNVAPSSSIVREAASETTWKPPESVRIGRSQPMNRCRPPSRSMRSCPGRRYRWYVFARTIVAPTSSRSSGSSALTVAFVPTGMNCGVSTTPCGSVSRPSRARVRPSARRRREDLELRGTRDVRRRSRAPDARPGSSHSGTMSGSARRGGGIS